MRTPIRRLPFRVPRCLSLLTMSAAIAMSVGACGDDGEASTGPGTPGVSRERVTGGPEDQAGEAEGCVPFCEKANECAAAAGRPVPPGAEACETSCEAGGLHRQAPAAIYPCAEETCGAGFEECTRRLLLTHMRDQDIAVFPPICQGLCEKAAWCHRRSDLPLGPGEDDCEAACEPGGAFADLPEIEMNCVHYPCGGPFTTCRREGGSAAPPQRPPAPGTPGGRPLGGRDLPPPMDSPAPRGTSGANSP